jgi:hypothetical protein
MEASPTRLAAGNPKPEIRGRNGGVVNSARGRGFGRANLGEELKTETLKAEIERADG